jgi:hypothetical protein
MSDGWIEALMIKLTSFFTALVVAIVLAGACAVDAQTRREASEVRGIVGLTKTYIDEPLEFTIGGGLRIPVTPRVSIEPEVLRLMSDRYESWNILGNVAFSLAPGARVAPYVVGGIGVNRERDKAIEGGPGTRPVYEFSKMTFSGGLGVRIALTDRVFLSPEGRLGSNNFPRLTVGIGVVLR